MSKPWSLTMVTMCSRKGGTTKFDHRLGPMRREIAEARAAPSGENDSLGWPFRNVWQDGNTRRDGQRCGDEVTHHQVDVSTGP